MEDTKKTLEQLRREMINEGSCPRADSAPTSESPNILPSFYDYIQPPPIPEEFATDPQLKKDERTVLVLTLLACLEGIGILVILAYWVSIFL